MTIQEKLNLEFECAIKAIYGDLAEEEFDQESENAVTASEIIAIAKKVLFYLDLD